MVGNGPKLNVLYYIFLDFGKSEDDSNVLKKLYRCFKRLQARLNMIYGFQLKEVWFIKGTNRFI